MARAWFFFACATEALWAAAQPVLLAQPAARGGLVESTGAGLLSLQEAIYS